MRACVRACVCVRVRVCVCVCASSRIRLHDIECSFGLHTCFRIMLVIFRASKTKFTNCSIDSIKRRIRIQSNYHSYELIYKKFVTLLCSSMTIFNSQIKAKPLLFIGGFFQDRTI